MIFLNFYGLTKHFSKNIRLIIIGISTNFTFSLELSALSHPFSTVSSHHQYHHIHHHQTLFKMTKHCKNSPDIFCYVCGSFATKLINMSSQLKSRSTSWTLDAFSGIQMSLAPHIICSSYSNGLRDGFKKRERAIPFTVPMICRKPKDSFKCYFARLMYVCLQLG